MIPSLRIFVKSTPDRSKIATNTLEFFKVGKITNNSLKIFKFKKRRDSHERVLKKFEEIFTDKIEEILTDGHK